jgi:hypothetical protein
MRAPHNAEGTLLSLGRPLSGLVVGGRQGSGYQRQRILESPSVAGADRSYRTGASEIAPRLSGGPDLFSTTKVETRIWYAHKPGMMFA